MLVTALEAFTTQLRAETRPGGSLEGLAAVYDYPITPGNVAAAKMPCLSAFFDTGETSFPRPGVAFIEGAALTLEVYVDDRDFERGCKRALRFLWSDDGEKGLIPYLACHRGLDVGEQNFMLKPAKRWSAVAQQTPQDGFTAGVRTSAILQTAIG